MDDQFRGNEASTNQQGKMRSVFSIILLFSVFLVMSNLVKAQSRDASFSPDGLTIVYVSSVQGINQIFTMNTDGSGKRQLTESKNSSYSPFYSPDGKKLIFMSLQNDKTLVCMMDSNGSNHKCLTTVADDTADPNWSPDGSKIVFASSKSSNSEIYTMDIDGSNWKQLTKNEASDQTPSISPDGKYIVFVSNRDGNNELYLMDINGRNTRRLTFDPRSDRVPRWSPDSKKIIWYSREPSDVAGSGGKSWNGAEIYEINVDETGRRQLTHNIFRDHGAVYAPDGTRILFTSGKTGKREIFVMNLDGSQLKQLTNSKN